MHLHVAQQHLAGSSVKFHVENGGVESLFFEGMPQGVVVELNQLGLTGATVNNTGRTASDAETAARTRPLLGALKSDEFHVSLLLESTATSVTPVKKSPHAMLCMDLQTTIVLFRRTFPKIQKRFS